MKVLILAAALVCVAVGQQTTCMDTQFTGCASSLATAVGVNFVGVFQDYTILQNAFQNMFTQTSGDITGLVNVCNALHQFYLCLGPTQIQLCLGVNGLIGAGRTPAQAYAIDGLLVQYQFMCGAGFYTALYNGLDCLQSVTLHYNSTLRTCFNTYQLSVANDPANACNYVNTELNCYQNIFRQNCNSNQGQSNIAGWWSCETQRNWILSQFFLCPMVCNTTPLKDQEQYFLDHHKVENGVHMFKMPDTFEQDAEGKWTPAEGKWMTG